MINEYNNKKKKKALQYVILVFLIFLMLFMKFELDKREDFIYLDFTSEVNELHISLMNALIYQKQLETSDFPDEVAYAIGYKVGILDNILSRGQTIRVYSNSKSSIEIEKNFNELYRYIRGISTTIKRIYSDSTLDYKTEIKVINQDLQRVFDFVEEVLNIIRNDYNSLRDLKKLNFTDSLNKLIIETKSEQLKIYFDTISMYEPKYKFK